MYTVDAKRRISQYWVFHVQKADSIYFRNVLEHNTIPNDLIETRNGKFRVWTCTAQHQQELLHDR